MTTAINVSLSMVAMALGVFVAISPARAAEILAPERLERLAPQNRTYFLRWYRAFGIILCLGGALIAFNSIWFSN